MSAERRPTKASEVVRELMNRPVPPPEPRPELRLHHDTPTMEVKETTTARDALTQLRDGNADVLALREQGSEPAVIMLPIQRYLDLVATELMSDQAKSTIVAEGTGSLVMDESALANVHVEEVHPGGVLRSIPRQFYS